MGRREREILLESVKKVCERKKEGGSKIKRRERDTEKFCYEREESEEVCVRERERERERKRVTEREERGGKYKRHTALQTPR